MKRIVYTIRIRLEMKSKATDSIASAPLHSFIGSARKTRKRVLSEVFHELFPESRALAVSRENSSPNLVITASSVLGSQLLCEPSWRSNNWIGGHCQ